MDHAAHNGFGENMKKIRADGQDTFDAGAHQGRGDDETTSGANAAGYKTGAQPDQNRSQKDAGGEKRRAVGLFTSQNIG